MEIYEDLQITWQKEEWKCTKVCNHNSNAYDKPKIHQLHRHADNEEKAKIIDKLENDLNEVLTCTVALYECNFYTQY